MYTEIRTYELTAQWSSREGDVATEAEQHLVPALKECPGFVGFYLVDGGSGTLASVVVCERADQIDEINQRAAEWADAHFRDSLRAQPQVVAGETIISAGRH